MRKEGREKNNYNTSNDNNTVFLKEMVQHAILERATLVPPSIDVIILN